MKPVHLEERLAARVGARPVQWTPWAGGYSTAERYTVALDDAPPWEVMPGAGELACLVAGPWAASVGLPPPKTAPNVREFQRRQLAVALDWLDRELA